MSERVYTIGCPFGGLGAGALGFLQANVTLFGAAARFRCVGSIDLDALASKDFEYLTGAPALVADVATLTPEGSLQIDCGSAAVADPRVPPTLTGLTPDPRLPGARAELTVRWYPYDLRSRTPFPPVLPTADGTWHRPLTTLELAVLQGLPAVHQGAPLRLHGSASQIREHIGNAVPVGAAQAIATEMLKTLVGADLETFALSSGGAVWVDQRREVVGHG